MRAGFILQVKFHKLCDEKIKNTEKQELQLLCTYKLQDMGLLKLNMRY